MARAFSPVKNDSKSHHYLVAAHPQTTSAPILIVSKGRNTGKGIKLVVCTVAMPDYEPHVKPIAHSTSGNVLNQEKSLDDCSSREHVHGYADCDYNRVVDAS